MLHKVIWVIIYCFFASSASWAQEQGFPIVKHYTPEEYGQSPQVFAACQDLRGWMYFGINGNIMLYNGSQWKTIPVPNQPSIYSIAQSAEDSTVYVGATGDFGYLSTENGQFVYRSLAHLLPEKDFKFTSIWQTVIHQGEVYFRFFEGIIRYTPGPEPKVKIYHRLGGGFIGGLISHGERLFAYHHQVGLLAVGEKDFKRIPQTDFFLDKRFYTGFSHTKDTVLIATRNDGLYLFSPDSDSPPTKFEYEDQGFSENNDIYSSRQLENGMICILSTNKGAYVIDKHGKAVQWLNQQISLQSDYTRHVFADANNLWITSNTGIDRINANFDLSYWNKDTGLNGFVETIIRHKKTIYIGTHQGAYYLNGNETKLVEGMPIGQTWKFLNFKKPNGEMMLLAATAKGIYHIKKHSANKLLESEGHPTANILFQSRLNPNRVYATEGKHLISILYQHGSWKHEGTYEELLDDIRGIEEAPDGSIWLGSFRNGMVKVQIDEVSQLPKSHKYYGLESGFESLKDIMPFRYQNKLLFGSEFGFYTYKATEDKFEPYCELGEQFCGQRQDIFSFKEMPEDRAWIVPLMTQKNDIGYIKTSNGKAIDWVFEPFQRIPKMMIRGFYPEASGIVWFGGEKGLFRYDLSKDKRNYQASFPIHIQEVRIKGDSLVFGGVLPKSRKLDIPPIPYKRNSIQFVFSAPFFEQENQTLYSYKLDRFNTKWSDWSKKTTKEYTYLEEGAYTFKVKAKNIYGAESPSAIVSFSILPPWQRTIWAYGLFLIAASLSIWAIIRLNTYRLIKEKEKLEDTIAKRTAEIVEQKEDILQKNVSMQQQKEEIQAQAESLKTANEFISLQKEDVEKHLNNMSVISQIGKELTASLDLENVIDKVYQHVNSLMDATEFTIAFYNDKAQNIDFKLLIIEGERKKGAIIPIASERFSTWVIKHKKPLWLHNVQEDYQDFIPSLEIYEDEYLFPSFICLPLIVENRIIGIMNVQSAKTNAYSTYHFDTLQALSTYVAVALDNSNAYRQLSDSHLLLEEKVAQRTAQIKQAFSELLTSHEQLDMLTYRSAHDLRGPIARLQGLGNIAKLEYPDHESAFYIDKILGEADQMDKLLSRIMVTQSTKTKKAIPEVVELNKLINQLLSTYKTKADAKNIELKFTSANIHLVSDKELLAKMIENVLDNAIKFYDKRAENPFVEVRIEQIENEIQIHALDNGIGISESGKPKLFDMFFVDHEELRGYGLGLFDSATIAEKLKGNILLNKRADKLTEFVIKLPTNAIFLHWAEMIQ
jgi:signal transduction histidine kinase/ligand-binding sensor domain-containing protein